MTKTISVCTMDTSVNEHSQAVVHPEIKCSDLVLGFVMTMHYTIYILVCDSHIFQVFQWYIEVHSTILVSVHKPAADCGFYHATLNCEIYDLQCKAAADTCMIDGI